jgi:hypothetical protein
LAVPGPSAAGPQPFLATPAGTPGSSDFGRVSLVVASSAPPPADLTTSETSLVRMERDAGRAAGERGAFLESNVLWNALERVGDQLSTSDPLLEVGPVALTGLVATSGYLLLNTRAGYWLLSLLTSRPLWKQFDPLEVLFAWEKEGHDANGNEETLQSLVE